MKKAIASIFYRVGDALALGYDAGDRSNRQRKDLGWGRRAPRDEDSLVGQDGTREMIRQRCADLRRNNAIVAGVCRRLSSFVVGEGILPQAKTTDPAWNAEAEAFWADWSTRCESRGMMSLAQVQGMVVGLRPTHGGSFLEFLDDGRIRLIETERVRQPQIPADGKNCVDGVRVDLATGAPVAYCVHSRDADGGFSGKHTETWLSAANLRAVTSPPWRPDQVREIPDLAPVVPHLQDIHEINGYVLNTAKLQSMVLAFLKKQGGLGMNSMPRGSTSPTVGSRQTFRYDWGQVLEGFPGDDFDMKVSPTPNPQHIAYMRFQLGLCAAALDFPYEFFTLDFSTCDYSRAKNVLLLVNKACRPWQAWLNQTLNQPLWNWRIAMAIRDKDLPPAPVNEKRISQWNRVDWQAPEETWIDRQEANQADLIEWQMGLGSMAKSAKKRGRDIEDLLREKAALIKLSRSIEVENGLPEGILIKAQIPGQAEEKSSVQPSAPVEEEGKGEERKNDDGRK